jgi:hypothetical protein
MKKIYLFGGLLITLLAFAQFTNVGDPNSKVKMLCGQHSKKWKLSKELINDIDVTHQRFRNCVLDDIYVFVNDKSFVRLENLNKCSSTSPDTIGVGRWSFNPPHETLVIYTNVDTITYTIESLTDTKAIARVKDTALGTKVIRDFFKAQ